MWLHILAKFFHQINEESQPSPLPPSLEKSNIKFSLRPQTLDYMIDQERKIKTLETELTLKTNEVMKAKTQLK